jgi:hypothetical protein
MLCEAPGFPHTHNHIPHKVLCYVIYVMYVMCWAYSAFGTVSTTVDFGFGAQFMSLLPLHVVHVVVASS